MLKCLLPADGKPIDPSSISVMTGTTYDQEFGFELDKLKVSLAFSLPSSWMGIAVFLGRGSFLAL